MFVFKKSPQLACIVALKCMTEDQQASTRMSHIALLPAVLGCCMKNRQ